MNKFFVLTSFCANIMLKKVFGSGARVKLLQQFLLNPEDEFFIRELTRILDEQINSLRRELENLESVGMLKSRERNRKKYYRVNPHFALLHEFTSIIRKSNEKYQTLLKKLNKLGDIELCVLSGAFIGKDREVDVFVVGDIKPDDLQAFINKEFNGEELKTGVMTKEDFLYRVTLKDKFVAGLFADSDNLVLKNKLKKDTEHLVG